MIKGKHIKGKYKRGLILLTIPFLLLSGCKKSELSYDVEKADNDSIIQSRLSVPDSCAYQFNVSEAASFRISMDTQNIVIPDVDSMSTVYYEKINRDNKYRKQIAKGIFDESEGIYAYDGNSMSSQMLAELRDYYHLCIEKAREKGDDTAEAIYESFLTDTIKQYSSAKELEPAEDYEGDDYIGFIAGKSYLLDFNIEGGGFELKRYPEEFTVDMVSVADETYAVSFTGYGDAIEQDLIQTGDLNVATMSREEAVSKSMNFLNDLGITDIMSVEAAVAEWECYDLLWGEAESRTLYDGYYITFTNEVNSVIPYIGYYDWVNSLRVKGEYQEGLTVQTYEVCINDNGIIRAVCHDNYSRIDGQEEACRLMSWDELLDTVDLHIEEYYTGKEVSGDIVFNYAELSYYMVEEDNGTYALKPVWIFSELEDIMLSYDMNMYPTELLIIDAVTGIPIEMDY